MSVLLTIAPVLAVADEIMEVVKDVADKIEKAILFKQRTNGRENISFIDNTTISKKIIDIYKSI